MKVAGVPLNNDLWLVGRRYFVSHMIFLFFILP